MLTLAGVTAVGLPVPVALHSSFGDAQDNSNARLSAPETQAAAIETTIAGVSSVGNPIAQINQPVNVIVWG